MSSLLEFKGIHFDLGARKKSIREHQPRVNTNNGHMSSDWCFRETWMELAMNGPGLSWKEILKAGFTWKSKEVQRR